MKLLFRKTFGVLMPVDEAGEKFMARIANGDVVDLEIKRPRNQKLHKKWWSMCAYMAENSGILPTKDHASDWLLIQLGYCTYICHMKGNVPIANSISFAAMDQTEFEQMYDKAMDLVCAMLPHIERRDVAQVLAEFAGVGALMEA